MKKVLPLIALFFVQHLVAQNWTGYPAGSIGVPYVNGIMTATVTKQNTTMNSGTPMFTNSTAPDCYIAAGSLALNTGFFNSYLAGVSWIQVDMDFSAQGAFNGTCNSATFNIRDINSGESFTDFLDVVEISAIDGNGNPIAAASITTIIPAQTTVVTIGTTKKIVGHNAASEMTTGGPYFSSPCNVTTVTVTPPIGVPLQSVRVVYRPGVGTNTGNAYYTVNPHPAVQYISISNITLSPMVGCSVTPLPVQLISFKGQHVKSENVLTWSTATEVNNNYFLIEKSTDAINYSELERTNGNGNANMINNYSIVDKSPSALTYYRLAQFDFDGTATVLGTISVDANEVNENLFDMYPNPAKGQLSIQTYLHGDNFITIQNLAGKEMFAQVINGIDLQSISLEGLPAGIFIMSISNGGKIQNKKLVISN